MRQDIMVQLAVAVCTVAAIMFAIAVIKWGNGR